MEPLSDADMYLSAATWGPTWAKDSASAWGRASSAGGSVLESKGDSARRELLHHQHQQQHLHQSRPLSAGSATKVHLHRSGSVDISVQGDSDDDDDRQGAEWLDSSRRESVHSASSGYARRRMDTSAREASLLRARRLAEGPRMTASAMAATRDPAAGLLSSSAAVAAAMNALQDKIRRLERDLERAEEAAVRADEGAARQQQAIEALKEKNENAEHDLRMQQEVRVKLETREEESRKTAEGLREQLKAMQARLDAVQEQAAAQRTELASLKHELSEERKTRGEVEALLREEVEAGKRRYAELEKHVTIKQAQLQDAADERGELEAHIQDLVALNQNLVVKLSEAGPRKGKAARKKRVPPVGGTHTQRRAEAKAARGRNGDPATAVGRGGGEGQLPPGARRPRSSSSESLDKQILRANLGHPVPFLLSKSPAPSFSVYGQTQSALADDLAYGLPAPGSGPSRAASKGASESEEDEDQDQDDQDQDEEVGTRAVYAEQRSPAARTAGTPRSGSLGAASGRRSETSEREISGVIASLRREMEELSDTYQKRLEAVSADDIRQGLCQSRSAELTALVERIEEKGQQLYSLERYRKTVAENRGRSPVRSPKAFDRKVAALRALHAYRQHTESC